MKDYFVRPKLPKQTETERKRKKLILRHIIKHFETHPLLFEELFEKLEEQKTVLVSANPLPPKQVHRSPRWHMKDKW